MTVTNSVLRDTVDLRIDKTVTGAVDGYTGTGTDFTVGYTCYLADPANGISGSLDIAAGAAPVVLVDDVPVGWTCHVVEDTPPQSLLVDRSYAWGTPDIAGLDDDGNVIVSGGQVLTVTNPIVRQTGSFSVVKVLGTTPGDGVVDPDATFSGAYSCEYDGSVVREGTWTVTGAGAATLTPAAGDLPASTECSATETAPDDAGLIDSSWTWGTPVVSDPVTVESVDAAAEVTVTNTPTRVYAPLSITKVFEGRTAALAPGAEVAGAWSCDYAGAQVEAGRWRLAAAGGTVDVALADGTLAGENGSILLPATSVCTVVEDTPSSTDLVDSSYAWNAPTYDPPSGTVTLSVAGDNVVTVTNSTDRVYGAFRITKVIDLAGPQAPGLQFTGSWTCSHPGDPDVSGTWQVDMDVSATDLHSGVLVGSQCQVAEDPPSQAPSTDPSYAWAARS